MKIDLHEISDSLRVTNLIAEPIDIHQPETVGGPSAQVFQIERLLQKLTRDVTGSIGKEYNEDFVSLVSLVKHADDETLQTLLENVKEEDDFKYIFAVFLLLSFYSNPNLFFTETSFSTYA